MNIGEVLETADSLYPNRYGIREKLGWCYEVSCTIRNEVNKRYDFVRTTADKLMQTLEDIGIDRVQSVMTRDRVFNKTNVRSWYYDGESAVPNDVRGDVRAVYLIPAAPLRFFEYAGRISVRDGFITFGGAHSFEKGDVLVIEIPDRDAVEAAVLDAQESVRIDKEIPDYTGEAVITKKLCDGLECEAPYDYMYVDYLIGKMCFYQNDFDAANRHMAQYNNKIALYQRFIKSRDAYSNDVGFHGFWGR